MNEHRAVSSLPEPARGVGWAGSGAAGVQGRLGSHILGAPALPGALNAPSSPTQCRPFTALPHLLWSLDHKVYLSSKVGPWPWFEPGLGLFCLSLTLDVTMGSPGILDFWTRLPSLHLLLLLGY